MIDKIRLQIHLTLEKQPSWKKFVNSQNHDTVRNSCCVCIVYTTITINNCLFARKRIYYLEDHVTVVVMLLFFPENNNLIFPHFSFDIRDENMNDSVIFHVMAFIKNILHIYIYVCTKKNLIEWLWQWFIDFYDYYVYFSLNLWQFKND